MQKNIKNNIKTFSINIKNIENLKLPTLGDPLSSRIRCNLYFRP